MKEENKKTKTRKLTDAICRDLPRLDKKYYRPGDYPGLEFWVLPLGTKTWYYRYRTKNKSGQQRKHLGNYPVVGVVEATTPLDVVVVTVLSSLGFRKF